MKPNTVGREGGTDRPADRYTRYAVMDTGLITGTILLTTDGEMPVEHLSVGDKLITRDAGLSKVEHIQRSTREVHTIALAAGSLGHTRPERDALLAGDQMVLIRDWRARALFNSERALAAACDQADIVVAARYLPRSCKPRWLRADRRFLDQRGGVAINLADPSYRTVSQGQGAHGWWRGEGGVQAPR